MEFGDWSNARYNTFNVRGNVDLKVNDWINTSIDGVGVFANDRSQRGNYWNDAASDRPYEYAPLIPIDLIDPENDLLRGHKNRSDEHTSELQSLMRISYAVFCLKKKNK